jgi:hypothetical protein
LKTKEKQPNGKPFNVLPLKGYTIVETMFKIVILRLWKIVCDFIKELCNIWYWIHSKKYSKNNIKQQLLTFPQFAECIFSSVYYFYLSISFMRTPTISNNDSSTRKNLGDNIFSLDTEKQQKEKRKKGRTNERTNERN